MITIGSVSFSANDSAVVSSEVEYFRTSSDMIIGGRQIFTVTGKITADNASSVMTKLKNIRNLGKSSGCVNVNLGGFSGLGKILDVNIEQGPDVAWVNVGAFTIKVTTQLTTIPSNSLGIVATDNIESISIDESIELGEDSHGYIMTGDGLSKSFVKYSQRITVKCFSMCGSSATNSAKTALAKLFSVGPTDPIFSEYAGWSAYAQSRTFDMSADGTLSLSATSILLPSCSTYAAFVDMNFESSVNHSDNDSEKYNTKGTIQGLAPVAWSEPANVSGFSVSKINAANSALSAIIGKYSSFMSWQGNLLKLTEQGKCPDPTVVVTACSNQTQTTTPPCLKPISATVVKSLSEGRISFDFEWASQSDDCENENSIRITTDVEVIERQPTIIEHLIPRYGTVIQNLNCTTRKRIIVTTTSESQSACLAQDAACNTVRTDHQKAVDDNVTPITNYIMTSHTETQSLMGLTIRQEFMEACTNVI